MALYALPRDWGFPLSHPIAKIAPGLAWGLRVGCLASELHLPGEHRADSDDVAPYATALLTHISGEAVEVFVDVDVLTAVTLFFVLR